MAAVSSGPRVGPLLRGWRERRRLSQLELALDADISARHLSFVETGRSRPSAEMVLLLAERLQVPLRERNHLLLAAGYAPGFPERALEDPDLAPVREALDRVLTAHEPYPAMVLDRHFDVVAANTAAGVLGEWVAPELLEPPVNALRIGFHPQGLAPWTVNLGELRAHFRERIERQIAITGDNELAALLEEVMAYPAPDHGHDLPAAEAGARQIVTPVRLRTPDGTELSLFGTVASFGFAGEVTTSELSIEMLFPADRATAEAFRHLPRR